MAIQNKVIEIQTMVKFRGTNKIYTNRQVNFKKWNNLGSWGTLPKGVSAMRLLVDGKEEDSIQYKGYQVTW